MTERGIGDARSAESTGQTLATMIMRRTQAHPSRLAIASGTGRLTYGELADHARALAERLRLAGVRPGTAVVSALPRSPAIGISVLGSWLAGGVYVPVDPDGPAARLSHLVADSQPGAIIVPPDAGEPGVGHDCATIVLDWPGVLRPAPEIARPAGDSPDPDHPVRADLAYITYTSGSTGLPKGVLIEHGSLTDMAVSHEQVVYADERGSVLRVALNAVTTADTFFSDFANLAFGRALILVDELTRRDPDRLARFIEDQRIEALDATPTQIRAMAAAGRLGALDALRILILGGEPIDPELWGRLRTLRQVRVYNLYGPTECTVDVTAAVVAEHSTPVIGTEFPGCRVLVVSESGEVLPEGQIGELWVTGPRLARGYLHSADQDSARFTALSAGADHLAVRAYRTGDLGRRTSNGQLEFLGRTDEQVSIDGFRVELGEVRAALSQCAGVSDSAVGFRPGPPRSLEAWVVLAGDTDQRAVRQQLASVLPRHAIPRLTVVTALDETAGAPAPSAAVEPEWQSVPEVIRSVWREVLEVPSISDDDDFFELGGNSLKGTTVVVAVREAITAEIPVRTIFDFPEFGRFCQAVSDFVSADES